MPKHRAFLFDMPHTRSTSTMSGMVYVILLLYNALSKRGSTLQEIIIRLILSKSYSPAGSSYYFFGSYTGKADRVSL